MTKLNRAADVTVSYFTQEENVMNTLNRNASVLTVAVVAMATLAVSITSAHAAIIGTTTYHAYDNDSQGAGTTSPFAITFGPIAQQDPDGGVGETTSLYDFRGLTAAPVPVGQSYFFLEDVHDGQFDSPGVTILGLQPRTNDGRNASQGSGSNTDNVDEDDGAVDGAYNDPRSSLRITSGQIRFTFDEGVLGALPTHVGLVFAERVNTNFTFTAYDIDDNILDATGIVNVAFGDPFLGVTSESGISYVIATGESEYDHLQYGRFVVPPVPEPSTFALAALGLLGLTRLRRRRR